MRDFRVFSSLKLKLQHLCAVAVDAREAKVGDARHALVLQPCKPANLHICMGHGTPYTVYTQLIPQCPNDIYIYIQCIPN